MRIWYVRLFTFVCINHARTYHYDYNFCTTINSMYLVGHKTGTHYEDQVKNTPLAPQHSASKHPVPGLWQTEPTWTSSVSPPNWNWMLLIVLYNTSKYIIIDAGEYRCYGTAFRRPVIASEIGNWSVFFFVRMAFSIRDNHEMRRARAPHRQVPSQLWE